MHAIVDAGLSTEHIAVIIAKDVNLDGEVTAYYVQRTPDSAWVKKLATEIVVKD
jgi:recombinational DNA repair protein RecR